MLEMLRKSRLMRLLLALPMLSVLAMAWGWLASVEANLSRFVLWGAVGISVYILLLRVVGYDPRRFSAAKQYQWLGREGPGPRLRQGVAVVLLLILSAILATIIDKPHFVVAYFGAMFGAFIYEGISIAVDAYGPLSY